MRIFRLCLGAALLMAVVAAGFAHADVNLSGTTAASFLTNGNGPRVLSMGGASLALDGDLQSAAWNPAALATMMHGEVTLAHAGLPGDAQQEWLGAGGRFGQSSTRWSLQGLYQGDGSFDGRDASNNPTGTFNASSFAVGAQLAQRFGDRAAIGAGAKFVSERLGDVSGMGATFDFGGQLHAGGFGVGASATNVGGQMRYSNAVYGFPASYGAGVSYALPSGLSVALDANFPKSYYNDVRFGAEWRIKDILALRAGYRHEITDAGVQDGLSGPTFGVGAGYNGIWLDYGYLVSGQSGGAEQRLAISFHPGGLGLSGASLGDNGTGASHAPTSSPHAVSHTAPMTAVSQPVGRASVPPPAAKPTADAVSTPVTATMTPTATPTRVTPAPPPVADKTPASKPTNDLTASNAAAAVDKPSSSTAKTTTPADAPAVAPTLATAPVAAATPAVTKSDYRKPAADTPRPEWVTVKSGDTMVSIARKYDTSVPAIMMENNMVSEKIRSGQKLKLPDHR